MSSALRNVVHSQMPPILLHKVAIVCNQMSIAVRVDQNIFFSETYNKAAFQIDISQCALYYELTFCKTLKKYIRQCWQ